MFCPMPICFFYLAERREYILKVSILKFLSSWRQVLSWNSCYLMACDGNWCTSHASIHKARLPRLIPFTNWVCMRELTKIHDRLRVILPLRRGFSEQNLIFMKKPSFNKISDEKVNINDIKLDREPISFLVLSWNKPVPGFRPNQDLYNFAAKSSSAFCDNSPRLRMYTNSGQEMMWWTSTTRNFSSFEVTWYWSSKSREHH